MRDKPTMAEIVLLNDWQPPTADIALNQVRAHLRRLLWLFSPETGARILTALRRDIDNTLSEIRHRHAQR